MKRRYKSGSKKACTEDRFSSWLLIEKKIPGSGKNHTNRLEVLKKLENIYRERINCWASVVLM
jgi:hypothetical protein